MSNNYRKGREIRRGRYRFDQAEAVALHRPRLACARVCEAACDDRWVRSARIDPDAEGAATGCDPSG